MPAAITRREARHPASQQLVTEGAQMALDLLFVFVSAETAGITDARI